MRYAIFSDVHANREALVAVLSAVDREAPDAILSLGDVVGYGAEPGDCIDLLQARPVKSVIGNHDSAVAGLMSASFFNFEARRSVKWTQATLSADHLAWLRNMPLVLADDHLSAFHGSLLNPEAFDYILSIPEAESSFAELEGTVGFHGHSHIPCAFIERGGEVTLQGFADLEIPSDARALINVGSVGQPRDGTPAACYLLYDTDTRRCRLRRVEYDVDRAVKAILAAGLPEINAYRLAAGR